MRPLLALLLLACPLAAQSVALSGNSGVSGNVQVLAAAPAQQTPLNITTASPMPNGDEGVAYSELLAATGGVTPYVWTLEPGDPLPPGLSLAGGGESLNDPSFDDAGAWGLSADVSISAGALTYAHSSGTGSILQGQSAPPLAVKLLPGATYKLTYVVSAAAGNPVATVTTIPAESSFGLDESVGQHETTFVAHANPHSFSISFTSDTGDDTISFSSISLEQQTGVGTIFGTPTVPGTFPFTVRVTDAQPVFDTQVLSITIDPETQAPEGQLFTYTNGATTGFVTPGGCDVTANGFFEAATNEIRKNTATDCVIWEGDKPQLFMGLRLYRDGTGAPATQRTRVIAFLDASANVLAWLHVDAADWDRFVGIEGITSGFGRGLFIGTPPADTFDHLRFSYTKGTGANCTLVVQVNGAATQTYDTGTCTANVAKVVIRDVDDHATQRMFFQHMELRDDTLPSVPELPPPPPPALDIQEDFEGTAPAWISGSGCAVETLSTMEGAKLMTKNTATPCTPADGRDDSAFGGGYDFRMNMFPATDRTEVFACYDSTATKLIAMHVDGTDGDMFMGTVGTEGLNAGRGALLLPVGTASAINTNYRVEFSWDRVAGQFTVSAGSSVTGMNAQALSTTATTNIERCSSTSANDGASGVFRFDRLDLHNEAVLPGRDPLGAAPPPPVTGTPLSAYCGAATGDGVTDNQACIQAAFNDCPNWTNKTLVWPATTVSIIGQRVELNNCSNWTIQGNGATIKAKNGMCTDSGATAGCTGFGPLLRMNNVHSFTVNNLDMDGNRANRVPAEKSGGHTVQIFYATGGTFRDLDWKNATTDALRIARTSGTNVAGTPNGLTFIDSKFSNSYRNNVSVIEGYNVRFLGTCSQVGGSWFNGTCTCQMTGANGTGPAAGIDWEPNPGSTAPNLTDGYIEGCLLADNQGQGYTETPTNHGTHNITARGNIIRNNQTTSTNIRAYGTLFEGNYIKLKPGGVVRFGAIYNTGVTSDATPLNPARPVRIQNNFIDGAIPVGYDSGKKSIMWWGNCSPASSRCGFGGVINNGDNTGEFKNNTITNSTMTASGDWCNPGPTGNEATGVSGNTVEGVLQAPNPGCP